MDIESFDKEWRRYKPPVLGGDKWNGPEALLFAKMAFCMGGTAVRRLEDLGLAQGLSHEEATVQLDESVRLVVDACSEEKMLEEKYFVEDEDL